MTEPWESILGTVLIDPPDDMQFKDLGHIIDAVTYATRVECGHEMAITCGGTMMFFHLTEEESDTMRDYLVAVFGEDFVDNDLSFNYDDDFPEYEEDEDEEE